LSRLHVLELSGMNRVHNRYAAIHTRLLKSHASGALQCVAHHHIRLSCNHHSTLTTFLCALPSEAISSWLYI
jgi:hypothetical protein